MAVPGSWRGIVNRLNKSPAEIQAYFHHLPSLAEDYPWSVSISYMFGLVELAQNNGLYCGVVKLHRVDRSLAKQAIDGHSMFRKDFRKFYEAIFGKKMKATTIAKLEEAESIRDRILHGKVVSEKDKRKAVVDIIEFAERFSDDVFALAKFKLFGDLRGFKGRGTTLDKSTSRWVLRGIGFTNV